MPSLIGKYQVLERIGRGGMGMVFKAHDPVLNRPVALKVISTEVEVTDELRARFFREAQACARLSHPNIVTIYDMGEHEGRLFIVMELLDGVELRQIIAKGTRLPLEDKLSVIAQLCDGLHYAHQKGIVHRDVKPGNIFLLQNGQVKILDFGIAQMATMEAGLTRTGLIMGTLRYIAPEQVRGRADARSDIYSVGAVCYELLGLRPPFAGDDPIHLLEQLRTEEPTPLHGLDPSLPTLLIGIVERAMRKEAHARYADLAEMRAEIELVQRGLREEAQRLRAHLREQLDEIFRLQRTVAERIGTLPEEAALPAIDDQGRLAAMQAIEQDFAARALALREKLARAEALAPALRRGNELLQSLQFADALLEFEAVLAEMPEHVRAQEALHQAQAQGEEQHRQQLASELLHDARAAYDEESYALCLEILKQASTIPPHGAIVQEIASLRQTAEAAFEAEEAARREREHADRARETMARARRTAEQQDSAHYAADHWNEAEARAQEAQRQYGLKAYAEARHTSELAATAYREAEVAAQEVHVRERAAAESGRTQTAERHREAREAGAPEYARDLWDAAEAGSKIAQSAFTAGSLSEAARGFEAASQLYRQATEAAIRQRDRQRAGEASEQAGQSRRSASAAGADVDAATVWSAAEAKRSEADAAFQHESYSDAIHGFAEAGTLYRQAESAAVEVQRQKRSQAEQARASMEEARGSATASEAPLLSPPVWAEAEATLATAEEAFAGAAYGRAIQSFEHASNLYRQAAQAARDIVRRREKERTDAEQAREAASAARRAAAATQASKYAAKLWGEAEAAEERARAALSRQEYGTARPLLIEARRLYASAAQAASVAADLVARRADAIMSEAQRLLAAKDPAACLRRVNEALAIKPGHPAAEALGRQAEALRRELEAAARDAKAEAPGEAATVRMQFPPEPSRPPTRPAESTELSGVPPASVGLSNDTATSRGTGRHDLDPLSTADEDDDSTVYALPRTRMRPSDSPVRDASEAKEAPLVAPAAPIRRRRLGARGALVAFAMLLVLAAVFAYWRGRPAPVLAPAPASKADLAEVQVVEALRNRVLVAKEAADDARVAAQKARDASAATPGTPPAGSATSDAATLRERASTAQRQGEEAIKQQQLERAVALFDEARKVYQEAERKISVSVPAPRDSAASPPQPRPAAPQRQQADTEQQRPAAPPRQQADAEQQRQATLQRQQADAEQQRQAALQRQQADAEQQRQAALQRQQADAEQQRQAALQRQQADVEQQRQAALQRQQADAEQQRQAALQRQQADAEQVRERVAAARRAAEQSNAARYAQKVFASAQTKERDATTALGRPDPGAAARLFRDAEIDYQAAKSEADTEQRRVAALQSGVDQSRVKMLALREQAMKAEADRLAKDLFDTAQAKQNEGDGLARRQELAAANQLYQDATERYLEARVRAQGIGEARSQADRAKVQMLGEKARANRDAREFRAGVNEERLGDALYERSAFRDATEKFKSAETLFTKAKDRDRLPFPVTP